MNTHKLIILGSGPAGWTAAIYAARASLNPILITGNEIGGQLMITNDVENYPGFSAITGPNLMIAMQQQAELYGTKIVYDNISELKMQNDEFELCGDSKSYFSKSVIIATGATAKWLGIPSEEFYQGHGVSGCATCDGFFFKDKIVCVAGGGNTAAEEALYLTHQAKKVYLVHRRSELRAEKILQDRVFANEKIECIWNSEIEEIIGQENPKKVTGVKLKFTNGDKKIIDLDGVFIAIGHKPNSEPFKKLLKLDQAGYIATKAGTTQTGIPGLFAAGDIQDSIYRQAVTAAGTGCMAALEAEKYLSSLKDV